MYTKINIILMSGMVVVGAAWLWQHQPRFHVRAVQAESHAVVPIQKPAASDLTGSSTTPVASLEFDMDFSTMAYNLVLGKEQLPDSFLKLRIAEPHDGDFSMKTTFYKVSPIIVSTEVYSDPKSGRNGCEAQTKSEAMNGITCFVPAMPCHEIKSAGGRRFLVLFADAVRRDKLVFTLWEQSGDALRLKAIADRTVPVGEGGRVEVAGVMRYDDNNYILHVKRSYGEGAYDTAFILWRNPRQIIVLGEIKCSWGIAEEMAKCEQSTQSLRYCQERVELTYKYDLENNTVSLKRHRQFAKEYNSGVATTFNFKKIIAGITAVEPLYYLNDIGEDKLTSPSMAITVDQVAETLDGNDTEKIQTILRYMHDNRTLGWVRTDYLTPEIGQALYRLLLRTYDPNDVVSKESYIRLSALHCIGAYKDKRALPYLLAASGDSEVVISLAMLGEPAVEPMFLKLKSRVKQERISAVGYFELLLHPKEPEYGEISMEFENIYEPSPSLRKRILGALRETKEDSDGVFTLIPGWENWVRTLRQEND